MIKRQSKQMFFRKNEEIKISEVRLTGDNVDNEKMSTVDALKLAEQMGLDLIEVNPQPDPSICKILDYKKFLYEEKRKKKDLDKKQKVGSKKNKEIRLGPNTGEHDMRFKAKQAIEFLNKGNKVYVNILFKGRNIIHKGRGEATLLEFATLVQESGLPENLPKLSGRKMEMHLKPIKNK